MCSRYGKSESKKKGAVELETVVVIVLALFAVALLYGLFSGDIQEKSKRAFCSTYTGIIQKIPLPVTGQAGVPEFCKVQQDSNMKQVLTTNTTIAARSIAGHVLACWKTTHGMRLGEDKVCYQLFFPYEFSSPVTEKNVTDIILQEGGCGIIENSDQGCGSRDEIIWIVDTPDTAIHGPSMVLISYNTTMDAIIVRA